MPLKIGQVAKQTGVGIETLRYYERERLIPRPPRRASGYREYPPEIVQQIEFILRAKALGFSLKEIRELLSLRVDPNTSCEEVRQRALAKLEQIDAKIQLLQSMRAAVQKVSDSCTGTGPSSACPILEHLEGKEPQHASS